MRRRRSIVATSIWVVILFAPMLGIFWLGYFPPILPFPGGVAALVLLGLVAYYVAHWRRRLAPTPTIALKERRCCVVGRLRRLEAQLVSPYSGRPCLAWLGFIAEIGNVPKAVGRSVPFVLEPRDGGRAMVVHLANGLGRRGRAWDHLGHAETWFPSWHPSSDEWDRAVEFVLPVYIEQARADDDVERFDPRLTRNAIEPRREVTYEDGDEVVLEGRFRRVADTTGLRSGDGLPTYQVVSRVVFAKGPAEIHGRWTSPWMRANVAPMLVGAICVEVVVHLVAFLLVHGVRW
jgi:hypothetical protein